MDGIKHRGVPENVSCIEFRDVDIETVFGNDCPTFSGGSGNPKQESRKRTFFVQHKRTRHINNVRLANRS